MGDRNSDNNAAGIARFLRLARNSKYEMRENVTHQEESRSRALRYALFDKDEFVQGISLETYEKEREWIDKTIKTGKREKSRARNGGFKRGFADGVRDVAVITAILFILFLAKLPGLALFALFLPIMQLTPSPILAGAVSYFLIAFVLNIGYKAYGWSQWRELSQLKIRGHVVGTLISSLAVSPFAYQLALLAFLLFTVPL